MTNSVAPSLVRFVLLSLVVSLAQDGALAFAALKGTPVPKGGNAQVPELLPLPPTTRGHKKDPDAEARKEDRRRAEVLKKKPLLPPAPDAACLLDAESLCADLEGHLLHGCLSQHLRDLSPTCLGALRPYINARIAASCAADARILCMGMRRSEAAGCLIERKSETSVACQGALELWPEALRLRGQRMDRSGKDRDNRGGRRSDGGESGKGGKRDEVMK